MSSHRHYAPPAAPQSRPIERALGCARRTRCWGSPCSCLHGCPGEQCVAEAGCEALKALAEELEYA